MTNNVHERVSTARTTVHVDGGDLPLFHIDGIGRGASIVIMPSAFGVNPDLEIQMEELAVDSRFVVAVDPFFRDDVGVIPYEDTTGVVARVRATDRPQAYRDLLTAIAWVRNRVEHPAVVVLGICFGGPFALLAAADGLADGVVTWHGSRLESVLERAGDIRCPLHLHFGGVDPFVPSETIAATRAAFAGRGDVRVTVHEGATHGFSHRSAPAAYAPLAERAGMASLRELVSAIGGRSHG